MKFIATLAVLTLISGNAQAQLLDFGGMFGHRMESGRKVAYNNPVTGRPGCPSGYETHHVHSAHRLDWEIKVCARPFNRFEPPAAVFGGLYSTDSRGQLLGNPMAQMGQCPRGFQRAQIHGSSEPHDNPLFLCYRNFRDGRGSGPFQFFEFGGLISHVEQVRANHVTGGNTCPNGFSQSRAVYGEANLDWSIYLCLENGIGFDH